MKNKLCEPALPAPFFQRVKWDEPTIGNEFKTSTQFAKNSGNKQTSLTG